MASYKVGDVVGVRSKRGPVDVVIKSMRRVHKGRQAGQIEYELAPVGGDSGKAYGFKAVGERFFLPPSKKYSAKEKSVATMVHDAASGRVEQSRSERDSRRQTAVSAMEPKKGDVITIRGRPYGTWEGVVASVNHRTGKVGIERDPAEVERMKQRRDRNEYINYVMQKYGEDEHRMGSRVQELRWIQPEAITKIERNGEIVWTEKEGRVAKPHDIDLSEPAPEATTPEPETMPPTMDEPAPAPAAATAPGEQRTVYGPPPGAKAKNSAARVHTRVKGRVYVPTQSPSNAKAGSKYSMSPKGNNLQVDGGEWTQEWEPYEENASISVGDIRQLVRESLES